MNGPEGILVDHELEPHLEAWFPASPGAEGLPHAQVQPASLDLRLGPVAHRVLAGFLPGSGPVRQQVEELTSEVLDLTGDGAILERGCVYLVPLARGLRLPAGVRARFNPRSSSGRLDLFTRVLVGGHPRFDEAPAGWEGALFLAVGPRSFPVRRRTGDRLCQVRLSRGRAELSPEELRERAAAQPLCFLGDRPLGPDELRFDAEGGLELTVGFEGREPAGWRAAPFAPPVTFGAEGAHDSRTWFEPVQAPGGRCLLPPGSFHIFASRERLRVPPDLAAEMLPVDTGLGELRNNYAGFFDSGFGWEEDAAGQPVGTGTPAVLEVRAHDVPFMVDDGQVFFRLKYLRTTGRPRALYGAGREASSYRGQDLTLARAFRREA